MQKFSKVTAINRLLVDIESLEQQIQDLRQAHDENERTVSNPKGVKFLVFDI